MIIWLASYPKSGNTWMRLFLKSYFSENQEDLEINTKLGSDEFRPYGFPDMNMFKDLNINYRSFFDIVKNWEAMQDIINLNGKTNYVKTHNALCTINNTKFTSPKNTLGAIYIVRDPRDVLLSYSDYIGQDHNQTSDLMLKDDNYEKGEIKNVPYNRALLGSWSNHYNSWKGYKEAKTIIVRYEDMIKNPDKTFLNVIEYINKLDNILVNKEKISHAINETNFKKLQNKEKKIGFEDNAGMGKMFFRKGKSGSWVSELDKKLAKKIEKTFESEMKELNYI